MVMLRESSCYSFVTLDGALLAISRSLGLVLKSAFSKENREHWRCLGIVRTPHAC